MVFQTTNDKHVGAIHHKVPHL